MYRPQSPRRPKSTSRYEPYLYVLDYLEMGNPSDIHYEHRNQPFVQGIGTKYFSLLEATPLIGVRIDIFEKVDLSYPSKLKKLIHISYGELTSVSRSNLPEAVRRILVENEKIFVKFFNVAEPINIRIHSLELLPDIGKKTVNAILDIRRRELLKSYDDIRERIGIDPVKTLTGRIISELVGGQKYYLFIKPREGDGQYLGYLERLYEEIFP